FASRITRLPLPPAAAPKPATRTRAPSGVNFSRFAPFTEIGIVCAAFFPAMSIVVTVASCALAAQISFPSGETSNPSAPRPAAMLVTFHVLRAAGAGPPGRAEPGGAEPGGPSGGGPPGPGI